MFWTSKIRTELWWYEQRENNQYVVTYLGIQVIGLWSETELLNFNGAVVSQQL